MKRQTARKNNHGIDYEFKGTKTDVVKQIGNSVPVNTAKALVAAALSDI